MIRPSKSKSTSNTDLNEVIEAICLWVSGKDGLRMSPLLPVTVQFQDPISNTILTRGGYFLPAALRLNALSSKIHAGTDGQRCCTEYVTLMFWQTRYDY